MKTKWIVTVLVIIAIAFLGVRAFQNPIPTHKLDFLEQGMNKEEVLRILGPPTKEYASGQWTYSRPLVFGFVNIHWDPEGHYPGWYNFERF